MMARAKVLIVPFLLCTAIVFGVFFVWPLGRITSGDLGCTDFEDGRVSQICRAIAGSMEWTWFGHAIILPGWRLTWDGLRQVHCAEQIGSKDRAALERLATARDWRLQSASENLIRLLNVQEGRDSEPENSIFNPTNNNYILRLRCDAQK